MKSLRKFISSNNSLRLFVQLFVFAIVGIAILLLWQTAAQRQDPNTFVASANQPAGDQSLGLRGNADFGHVPLSFEANEGQTAPQVQFLSRGPGYTLFLTPTKAVLSLQQRVTDPKKKPVTNVLPMELMGANSEAKVEGRDELPGKSNYFIGNDPKNWHVDVPTFAKVNYQSVYEGVDLVYYGNQRQLEYDFIVAPNADASQIRWAVPAVNKAEVDEAGGLVLHVNGSDFQMKKPVVYQTINGERREIAASYSIQNPKSKIQNQEVGFTLGLYDHAAPLVIDPVLVYSTFLGSSFSDYGYGIAVDASGSAYVTGETNSATFPTQNSNQTFGGGQDAFITKFNPAGTLLVYSTFLGGSTGFEHGYDIAVDSAGNAYVTGTTIATDFPTTANALQPTKLTGSSQDTGFVTRLSPGGTLFYSTYLSGSQSNQIYGIGTDGAGNAYVTGACNGLGIPTTANAFISGTSGTGFLTKLNTNASGSASLVYSTLLNNTGGSTDGRSVAVEPSGNVYLTGRTTTATGLASPGAFQAANAGGSYDAFVMKFNTNLSGAASRIYSTYLGGSLQDFGGRSNAGGSKAIAIDTAGNAYVTGNTNSTNFPVMNPFQAANAGYYDAFLTKLNATGSALIYSTYLGGSNLSSFDEGRSVAVNVLGNAYVTGIAGSADFPTAFPISPVQATGHIFVAKFTPSGNSLVYSTRIGTGDFSDEGNGIALDGAGNAFVTGGARTIPTTAGAFQPTGRGQTDAFATQIADPTVIGRVVDEDGNPISGAIVGITGVPSGTTMTDANGFYTFGLLTSANNYTISVTVPNYIFTPQVVNNLVKNVRLDLSPLVFGISGQATTCSGPQGGVTMTLTDGKSLTATTDGSGYYSLANLPAGRNYTITPSQTGVSFTPPSRTFSNLSADQSANFAIVETVSIGGRVLTADGRPLRNGTVTITGPNGYVRQATTSSFGFYTFPDALSGQSYTLTVFSRFFRFPPRALPVTCSVSNVDFVGQE